MENLVPQYSASDIMVTWYRAVSPAGVGATLFARAEALTQAEFHVVDAALQTPGCRECPWPLSVTKRAVLLSYAVVPPNGGVTGAAIRLHSTREDERGQDLLWDSKAEDLCNSEASSVHL